MQTAAAAPLQQLRLLTAEQLEATGDELTERATLSAFFHRWFIPRYARPNTLSNETVRQYAQAIDWWARITGDPPLADISKNMAGAFVAELLEHVSRNTARKHAKNLNRVFAKTAGTPFDDSAELLTHAPKLPAPKPDPATVRHAFTAGEVEQLLAACHHMSTPALLTPAPPPAAWWQAVVLLAYLQGFRVGTILQLRFAHVDTAAGLWHIPAEAVKGRRSPIVRQLHPQAAEIVEAIRAPTREELLPWYGSNTSRRFFFRQVERLVRLAGLPDGSAFRTHALRRGHGTQVAAIDPEAARLSLGHSLFATTAKHYIGAAVAGKAAAAALRVTVPQAPRNET